MEARACCLRSSVFSPEVLMVEEASMMVIDTRAHSVLDHILLSWMSRAYWTYAKSVYPVECAYSMSTSSEYALPQRGLTD